MHLDFLFKTNSLKDEALYVDLKVEYDTLSKRINTFIQWAEESFKP